MKRVLEIIKKPEMRILPGQLAFFLLLSIIPLFAIIAAVAGEFSLSIEALTKIINENLPKEVADFIIQIIGGKSISINIIIFCISGFILASNGPHSMIISSNILYKVKDKDFLSRNEKVSKTFSNSKNIFAQDYKPSVKKELENLKNIKTKTIQKTPAKSKVKLKAKAK